MKISIEGNISSGKSTVLSNLQKNTRIPVFLEAVNEWTLLKKFYQNIERWGFAFNMEVLLSMSEWKNNNYFALYERSPMSCRYVFVQNQFEQKQFSKEELTIFDKIYKKISWEQEIIIYIKTDPEVCFDRMKKRNRNGEETVNLSYLQIIDKKHDDMLSFIKLNKPHIKIIIINGNDDIDIVYNNILKILEDIRQLSLEV
jgi:deoxyadenosine/deoxycytidine kinase